MFNTRRDIPGPKSAVGRQSAAAASWPVDPQADYAGGPGQAHGLSERQLDDIAAALEAELGQGLQALPGGNHGYGAGRVPHPMQPVDIDTGEIGRGYDQWDDAALDELAEELSRIENFDPQHADYGVLPPHPQAEEAAAPAPAPARRFGVRAMAVSVGALLAGGAAVYALTGEGGIVGNGGPVMVAAPTAPFKIVPKEGDTIDEPIEGNVVFNNGTAPPKSEERLLARTEEEIPDLPGVTPQVNRVILPDGQEIVTDAPTPVENGPRRVRTVLVRPDGTILEAPERPVRSLPSPTDPTLATDSSPIAEAIAQAEDVQSSAGLPPIPPSEQQEVAPAADAPAAASGPDPLAQLQTASDPVPAVPVDVAEFRPTETPGPVDPAPVAAAPEPAESVLPAGPAPLPQARPAMPSPAPEPAEIQVASSNPIVPAAPAPVEPEFDQLASAPATQPEPVALPPAPASEPATATAPADAPAPVPAAAAYVQVSSQRSEEAALATFKSLQAKHPDLLAGVTADVQRADLGAKGVYYRVRVPRDSRGAAADLCASLKAAGSDCIVARR
jgi:hypothetical protein